MKLLLHTCCAPCLIYPLEQLRKKDFYVEGLFYNPNIHPFAEYKARRAAVENIAKDMALEVTYPEYTPSAFFREVNLKEVNPGRCAICWGMRLKTTARAAKARGLDAFTTTLLVSPYQDIELLKEIGLKAGQEEGIEFYYEDFRPGFRSAHDQARAKGIYCQKYCGCLYSEMERCRKSARP
ncbi:MAG: epoxyqueuosine reductase QueH [Candidatus Omnitrophica bacterium]|nr:epoxyqueuosine reductase QueH [Candidatus Omnitrophota bacterium]